MKIINSTLQDIPEIFRIYRLATEYQKLKFPGNIWPEFDEEMVKTEIHENRQFKIVIGNKVAFVWAITYSDPEIWEEADNDSSIYIHRTATNPEFRGNNFVKVIVSWAKEFAKENGKIFIRMDTCGNNQRLIEHYKHSGFNFLGIKKIKNFSQLPAHYHNAEVCYFEIKL